MSLFQLVLFATVLKRFDPLVVLAANATRGVLVPPSAARASDSCLLTCAPSHRAGVAAGEFTGAADEGRGLGVEAGKAG